MIISLIFSRIVDFPMKRKLKFSDRDFSCENDIFTYERGYLSFRISHCNCKDAYCLPVFWSPLIPDVSRYLLDPLSVLLPEFCALPPMLPFPPPFKDTHFKNKQNKPSPSPSGYFPDSSSLDSQGSLHLHSALSQLSLNFPFKWKETTLSKRENAETRFLNT